MKTIWGFYGAQRSFAAWKKKISCLCWTVWAAVKKRFTRGEFLYRAGEPAGMAALVLDGMFHIDREDYWGNNSILADVSAGELLGEVYSFLDDEPVRINAVAVKDSTVLLLDVKKIFQVCSTVCPYHAQLIRNFAYVLAVKNRELTRKLEHMSQRTTRDKLLSYLSDQSLKQDSSCFEIPFNRQQLADFLAVALKRHVQGTWKTEE